MSATVALWNLYNEPLLDDRQSMSGCLITKSVNIGERRKGQQLEPGSGCWRRTVQSDAIINRSEVSLSLRVQQHKNDLRWLGGQQLGVVRVQKAVL
jgi:hypothetical protein